MEPSDTDRGAARWRPEEDAGGGGEAPGRLAVFDPFSGISGDMVLGCWVDLGLDREWLLGVAEAVGVRVDVEVERVMRAGLCAPHVRVITEGGVEAPGDHGGHGHGDHASHGSRSFTAIVELIEASALGEAAKRTALGAFTRLAEAEGRVHGVPAEEVHFHEVGAVDAIVDVCAAADGFSRLGLRAAATLPVALGRAEIEIAHGRYPAPAPATGYLLEGTTVQPVGYRYETVTPTGAALLAELCGGRSPHGDLVVERVAYGAGTLDPRDHPNCLRVWIVRRSRDAETTVVVLQTDVDDMAPEHVPGLIDACLEAGALDATVQTVYMKKGRPAWRLEAQVEVARRDEVEAAIFRHSGTLGVRGWRVRRRALPRRLEERTWEGRSIRVKVRMGPDGERAKAEHDDVAAAARALGLAQAELLRRLRRAWPDLA